MRFKKTALRLLGKPAALMKKALRSVWFWFIMLAPTAFFLIFLAANVSGFADTYCRTVYRGVSLFWNNISGILPFSLGEMILILLPAGVLAYIIFVIVRTVRSKGRRIKTALGGFLRTAGTASLVFFLFVTNCGINYYCTDFSELTGLETRKVSAEELYEVCVYLADGASECRERLDEDDDGIMKISVSQTAEYARDAVNGLHSHYDFVPDGYSVPKSVMLSEKMSYLKITGVYFPFTFEANVNTDVPDFSIPFTMCHELAHVRGFMHEEDANFIAYLACVRSDKPELKYSAYTTAILYTAKHLYSADRELYSKYLTHLSAKVRKDLAAHSEYWSRFETPAAKTASKINDSYLKSNAQKSGVKSYGRLSDLIIAYYFDEKENACGEK